MAVDRQKTSGHSQFAVGLNVLIMVVLAVTLTGMLQWLGYRKPLQADLTSSGVNSLTPATENLLHALPDTVRLTSLYFQTDLEAEDQPRYRDAVDDLLSLYRATNRSKIETEYINPLQNLDKRRELFARIAGLPKFKAEAEGHTKALDAFRHDLLPKINDLVAEELSQLEGFAAVDGTDARLVSEVKQIYAQIRDDLEQTSLAITDAMNSEIPAHGAATKTVEQVYATVLQSLKSVINVGSQITANPAQLSPPVASFFTEAEHQYANLIANLENQQQTIRDLPRLSIDEVVQELRSETSNAILVEANGDAKVVPFHTVWQPINSRSGGQADFANRRFLGEQKVTSAILQLTQKTKPAAVFVRHGGAPLFFGGFMPGQPPALLAEMKEQLEDANFGVYEWDLATAEEMPAIDPEPSRTIFVVLRPTPSQQNMMGQPPQDPPFTPEKLEILKKAMGDSPRAVFLAGYLPGMYGMSAPYEYAEYLRSEWGIEAECNRVLLVAEQVKPGQFQFTRQPLYMTEARFAKHPITSAVAESRVNFPLVSPLALSEQTPEGVTRERLAWLPEDEGLWSVGDLSYYSQQRPDSVVRNAGDLLGEFLLSAVASKNEGKVVVVGSGNFEIDEIAMAAELAPTAQGFVLRSRNPGNAAFFINSLHWLNDNTEWVNLGTPISVATISIDPNSSEMSVVKAIAWIGWPGLTLCIGVIVWRVRRR